MTVIGKGLALENRHTGEKLEMTRVIRANQSCLAMRGLLPPHRQGPPLHVHYKFLGVWAFRIVRSLPNRA